MKDIQMLDQTFRSNDPKNRKKIKNKKKLGE